MSTAITTAYGALKTRIESVLGTGFLKIPNPYEMENNSDGVLRKGYGIRLGQATNVQAVSCEYIVDRTFTVVICRESLNTDHDADGIAAVELQLAEDVNSIVRDFEREVTLNTGLIFTGYRGDSGIQLLRREQAFLYVEMDIVVKIIQSLY